MKRQPNDIDKLLRRPVESDARSRRFYDEASLAVGRMRPAFASSTKMPRRLAWNLSFPSQWSAGLRLPVSLSFRAASS